MSKPSMQQVPLLITEVRRENPSNRAPRYKISLVKEAGSVYVTARPIHDPRVVFEMAQMLFEEADREAFYVICLDAKSKVIGVNLVSLGSLSNAIIHPREVFKVAILLNSSSIICVHNHPSGDPEPSRDDTALTARLVSGGELLGISVRDHIVCGETNFFSYQEHGMIDAYKSA